MSLVYVLRHGNTFDKGDVIRRVGGRTDLPLSTSGHIQAERIAEHFAHIDFGYIYASHLKRQHQTAQAISKAQKRAIEIEPLAFLTEIDYGLDENKPESDVVARIGAAALEDWNLYGHAPQGWQVDRKAIANNWAHFFAAQRDAAKPTLVVTSNGTARFILDIAAHEQGLPRKLRTGAYGIVDICGGASGDMAVILSWDIRPDE